MSIVEKSSQPYSGFDPTQIPGCTLWLDAADSSTLTLSGSSVTSWRDKSGGGISMTASTTRPTLSTAAYNGRNAINFGGSACFQNTTFPFTTSSRTTFFVYDELVEQDNVGVLTFASSGTDYNQLNSLLYETGNKPSNQYLQILQAFGQTGGLALTIQPTTISFALYSDTFGSARETVYVNGTQTGTATTSAAFTNSTGLIIGGRMQGGNVSGFLKGNIGEILLFTRPLGTLERQQVEGYLAAKWGLVGSIPATHPFKLVRPVARPFSPLDVPGCTLWLDAADSTSVTRSGTSISQWSDKSGTGNHATQATSARQPVYGTNAVTFTTASQQFLSLPNGGIWSGNSPLSIYVVVAPTSTYSVNVFLFQGNIGTASSAIGMYSTGTQYADYWQSATPSTQILWGTAAVNTVSLISYVYTQNTNLIGYWNGAGAVSRTANAYTVNTTNATIGAEVERSFYSSVRMYEVIIYNTTSTTTQRQQIEGYLAWKWGVQSTIPTTHPFKRYPSLSVAFSPAQLPSCALWLDADDSSTMTLSGSNVTQWREKSGNGRTASVAAGTLPYSSQTRSVAFNGSSYFSLPTNTFPTGTSDYSLFVVVSTSLANYYWIVAAGPTSAGQCIGCVTYPNGAVENGWWSTNIASAAGTVQANTVTMIECIYTAPTLSTFTNGTFRVSSSTLGARNGQGSPNYIGARTDSTPSVIIQALVGNIYEILVFSGITSGQRQQVEGYLATKWGLTANLPSTHPYKRSTP